MGTATTQASWTFSRGNLRRLDLKPREEFLRDRALEWIDAAKNGEFDGYHPDELDERLRFRRIGRTTEMLLVALRCISEGKPVLIMAFSGTYACELRARLRDWCRALGLGTNLVLRSSDQVAAIDLKTFHDHYSGR